MSGPEIPPVRSANRPLWSVMIPVFRPDFNYLRQAVESVRAAAAGVGTMQLALVLDGDGAEEPELDAVLRQYRSEGLEVFPSAGRLGIGGNWNRCLALARGQYVHILHQDDRVRPGFYSAVAAGLATDPSIGAAFTQHAFISTSGAVLHEGHLHRDAAGVFDDWLEYVVANLAIQCPSIVVRRSVYEALDGFDESYRYCLDRAKWQQIAAAFRIWHDPRPLAEYRSHAASESASAGASLVPWREARRCLEDGVRLVPGTARGPTAASGRCHLVRLALSDARRASRSRRWRAALACLCGAALIGRPADFLAIVRGNFPRAPLQRPSPGRQARRVTVITEFFPNEDVRSVSGSFSRLRRLLRGAAQVGEVDVVFFWPPGREATAEEQDRWDSAVRNVLPVSGRIRFVATGRRNTVVDIVADLVWMLRGALSYFAVRPSMRTTAREPVRALRRVLAELQPDLILAQRIGTASAVWRAGAPMPPLVIDVDDIEDVKLARLAATKERWIDRAITRTWALVARVTLLQVGRVATRMLAASAHDRTVLQQRFPRAAVDVIPNSADRFAAVGTPSSAGPVAVFVGFFRYQPNAEGMAWFVREVWPEVRRAVPDARLQLVGAGAEGLGIAPATDGIEVLGFVEDLAPVYRGARLAVCPIHRGAGTRIKIIEAAMNGRPAVSTTIGAEGLDFTPGDEIVLADEPRRFAAACITLLQDAELADRLGRAALRRASSRYDAAAIEAKLARVCVEAMAEHGSAPIAGTAAAELVS